MSMRTRLSAYVTSLVGLSVLLIAASPGQVQRFFSYDKKPSTGVIEVMVVPSSSAETVTFTLFGDGRLRILQRSTGRDQRVVLDVEKQLGESAVEAIVRDLVDAGVVVFDSAKKQRELNTTRGRPPMVADGARVLFQIELEQYSEGADPAL